MGKHPADRTTDGYVTAWSGDLGWDLPPDMRTMLLPLPAIPPFDDPVEAAKDPNFLRIVLHALKRMKTRPDVEDRDILRGTEP
ncbi:hypothetical protein [Saccharopolyspora spinosa]|uniref:hypothetical protein n=1 Tax=Saccharopolyspora spinosa TaxID=60894 RepID=UPI00023798B5|nr:hypothetical protein [Saccharopolyspora spinosa]